MHTLNFADSLSTKARLEFKILETVKVALEKGRPRLLDFVRSLLKKSLGDSSADEVELDLIELSITELGFSGIARYEDICWRGQELGLDLVPWCRMVPEKAITDPKSNRRIFAVDLSTVELWLMCYNVKPKGFYDANDHFIFVKPRK